MHSSIEQYRPRITPEELGCQLDRPGSKRGLYALLACAAIGVVSWAGLAVSESDAPTTKLRGPAPVAPASGTVEVSTPTTAPTNSCLEEVKARREFMSSADFYIASTACDQEAKQGGAIVDARN